MLMVALVNQKNNINVSKVKTKFCLSLHYNTDNNYLFVSGKEICKSKISNKNNNFESQSCLGQISNKSGNFNAKKVFLKRNVHDF